MWELAAAARAAAAVGTMPTPSEMTTPTRTSAPVWASWVTSEPVPMERLAPAVTDGSSWSDWEIAVEFVVGVS